MRQTDDRQAERSEKAAYATASAAKQTAELTATVLYPGPHKGVFTPLCEFAPTLLRKQTLKGEISANQ